MEWKNVNLEESPIERLWREKKEDALEVYEDDTLEFLSPDRTSTSKVVLNKWKKELYLETKLYHSARMIDENIYMASNIIAGKFTEEQLRQIIEDISARLRQIEIPKMLREIPYNFKIVEQDSDYTKFAYTLSYADITSYDELRTKFETVLVNSFELIYGYLMKMGYFIQTALNQFKHQPQIELKLMEIRTLIFREKFYATMTGRFANDQRRIAQSMKEEALNLIKQFEEEYPDIAQERLREIREFFDI
ncbi:MAG: hypothetical protein ACTSYB_15315 [Candidatus Helarchaeota archaeon]